MTCTTFPQNLRPAPTISITYWMHRAATLKISQLKLMGSGSATNAGPHRRRSSDRGLGLSRTSRVGCGHRSFRGVRRRNWLLRLFRPHARHRDSRSESSRPMAENCRASKGAERCCVQKFTAVGRAFWRPLVAVISFRIAYATRISAYPQIPNCPRAYLQTCGAPAESAASPRLRDNAPYRGPEELPKSASRRNHIGGVTPSRPTRHTRPCNVPSSCLTAAMKTFAPGLRSVLSPRM